MKAQTARADIARRAVMEAAAAEQKCARDAEDIIKALDVDNPLHGTMVDLMAGALTRNTMEAARLAREGEAAKEEHSRLSKSADIAADRLADAQRAADRAAERRRIEAMFETGRR